MPFFLLIIKDRVGEIEKHHAEYILTILSYATCIIKRKKKKKKKKNKKIVFFKLDWRKGISSNFSLLNQHLSIKHTILTCIFKNAQKNHMFY
jgi:hypothetical protein